MIQPDFKIVFFGGGEGSVFVVVSAFKSFILKLDMITSIFLRLLVYSVVSYSALAHRGLGPY